MKHTNIVFTKSHYSKSCLLFYVIVTVLTLLLFVYLVSLLLNPPDPLATSDAQSYWYTAGQLLEEHQFRERFDTGTIPSTWRPPLTAVFLSGARLMGLQTLHVLWLYWAMTMCTALIIFFSARELTSDKSLSLLAGFIYLAHPQTYINSRVIMSETPFMLLLSGSLFLVLLGTSNRQRNASSFMGILVIAGLLFGLSLLCRTVAVAFLPGLLFLMFIRKK